MTHKWRVILILFSFSMWLGGVVNAAPPAKKVVVQEPLDVSVINAPVVVPAPPADQLICLGSGQSLLNGNPLECLQASLPGQRPGYTMDDLLADGWIIRSVGGPTNYSFSPLTIVLYK